MKIKWILGLFLALSAAFTAHSQPVLSDLGAQMEFERLDRQGWDTPFWVLSNETMYKTTGQFSPAQVDLLVTVRGMSPVTFWGFHDANRRFWNRSAFVVRKVEKLPRRIHYYYREHMKRNGYTVKVRRMRMGFSVVSTQVDLDGFGWAVFQGLTVRRFRGLIGRIEY